MSTRAAIGLSLAGTLMVVSAQAAPLKERAQFSIAAQDMESALIAFTQQSNLQLIVAAGDLNGVRTGGLTGSYEPRLGLTRLLSSSGLTWSAVAPDTVAVRPAQQVAQASPAAPVPPAAEARAPAGLEEIIVNARRVEENIQQVPIAITAFTPETLVRNDIRAVTDLQRSIPGLQICCGPALSTGTAAAFLRGIPGVVGYFADVPTPLNGYGLYFDMGGVQALKGPQGTLFGLSTDGGALLFQPRKPVDRFEGYVQGTVGTHGRASGEAVVNVPVVPDKLLLRVGGMASHTDGYLKDLSTDKGLGDQNYWIARASATVRPTDDFENYALVNYYRFHGRPLPAILIAVNPTGPAGARFGLANLNAALATQQALGFYKIAGLSVPGTYTWTRQLHLIDVATWNVADNLTIKNIAGYVTNRFFSRTDIEGTQFQITDTPNPRDSANGPTRTWSEELQLQGKLLSNRLSYTLGTFHSGNTIHPVPAFSIALGNPSSTYSKISGQTHAVYGQGNYDLSDWIDGLTFTAGYRYTWDIRRSLQIRFGPTGLPVSNSGTLVGHFHAGSYTLQLSYQASPGTMFYVNNSKGYSSGGFNLTAPAALQKYTPESLNNVEFGVKSQWQLGSMQARTNLSGFYGFYDNVQVSVTRQVQTPTGPVIAVVVDNAATAHVYGVEGEATLVPVDGLELGGNVSYFRNRYDQYMTLAPVTGLPIDNSNLGFVYAPRWKYTLNGTVHLPIERTLGDVSFTATWTWQSKVLTQPTATPRAVDGIQGFGQLNLNVDWRDVLGYDGLDLSMFLTNVTQNHWTQGGFGAYDVLGILGRYGDQPRMFGARARYSF